MKYKPQLWPFAMGLICLSAYPAVGAFVFNITQQGLNVSVVGAGTLDTSALTPGNSGSGNQPGIQPAQAILDAGPMSITSPIRLYSNGISGPSNFGSGEFRYQASTGSGDVVGIAGSTLILPSGYISNSTLSDSNLFPNETISYIGMTPGTYVYTWGSGPTADSLTINVGTVPEPASLAMLGVPAALALLRRRRGGMAILQPKRETSYDPVSVSHNNQSNQIHLKTLNELEINMTISFPRNVLTALVCLSCFVQTARASFIYNVVQLGSNVVTNGSGTIDTASLSFVGGNETDGSFAIPSEAWLVGGPIGYVADGVYRGISGPSAFGTGGTVAPPNSATSGGGDLFGTSGGTTLFLPPGYQSEAPLSNTDTYNNTTISLLGFTPGTYVYTWGSGPTADSLTINVGTVPEPASLAMLGVPAALALLRRRRGGRHPLVQPRDLR